MLSYSLTTSGALARKNSDTWSREGIFDACSPTNAENWLILGEGERERVRMMIGYDIYYAFFLYSLLLACMGGGFVLEVLGNVVIEELIPAD